MSKQSKRDIILQEIIRAYLKENLPIGSSLLNERMSIPASTIRVYFKKLSDEGVLTQLHVSSGRIPTCVAMKGYWEQRLDVHQPIYITNPQNFGKVVDDFGLYCMINTDKEESLDEIISVEGRFLLLVLGKEQIVLAYDDKLATFLEELKGVSLSSLKQISLHFGLEELSQKLDYLKANKILFKKGQRAVFDRAKDKALAMEKAIEPSLVEELDEGLFFDELVPDGYMAVKTPAVFEGKSSHLFCLGEVYTDFERFFERAKEV